MSKSEKAPTPATPLQDAEEGFLTRWSRVKNEQTTATDSAPPAAPQEAQPPQDAENAPPPLTDEDMPALESLSEQSDLQPFLSSGVSDGLRRKAFRKIFLNAQFNIRDGLDDYDEDFTNFTALGDVVTAEYRRWRERMEAIEKQEKEQEQIQSAAEEADDAPRADAEEDSATADTQEKEEENDGNK